MKTYHACLLSFTAVILLFFHGIDVQAQRVFEQAVKTVEHPVPFPEKANDHEVSHPDQCGETITFTYRGQQVTYGTVLKDYGGDIGQRCWMDRNLGASQVATASNDPLGFGDTFQWGRLDDGHQDRHSGTTSTPSITDVPGHGNFITGAGVMSDWRSPQNDNLWQGDNGINNPCPSGWRIPTEAELNAERLSWGSNNSGGAFESSLKLTVGGYRNNSGSLVYVNSAGIYWTSDVYGGQAKYLNFQSNAGLMYFYGRTGGFSVRCVMEETATADAPTVTTEAITGITTTTATGGGNVTSDGGAAVTARGICYSTSPNPTAADHTVQADSGTGSFTATMTGLTPGTEYYVRAFALNSTGTAYGSQVSFVTSEEDPDPDTFFAGGTGTHDNPYQLATAQHLDHIRLFPGKHYIMTSDIDLGVAPWNQGEGWLPIGSDDGLPFTGSIDGNGFSINNLMINRPDKSFSGLFNKTFSASIQRLRLPNVNIKGNNHTAALAGLVTGGIISEVVASGEVHATGDYVGGLVGEASQLTIRQSTTDIQVTGHRYVGGLAGQGRSENCSSSGPVSGNAKGMEESAAVGGLLGQGHAINSHATGAVSGGHELGGLIGKGTAINSYAKGHVQARGDYAGGLIGLLADVEGLEQQAEYLPGEAAPGTTETETVSTISQPNQAAIVSLGDGTRAMVPGQDGPLSITLEKSSPDVQDAEVLPPWTNFRTTGSMRKLIITGNTGTETLKPVITFPIEEAGYINLETINVLRISHMDIEGELHPDHVSLLPVLEIDDTGLKFIDILFPEAVMDDTGKSTTRQQATSSGWVGEVRYILMSFDKSLNWSKRPVLEQMIPDAESPDNAFRQAVAKADADKRNDLLKKPVCNVVILVHGHNEEEKDGYLNSLVGSPWEFNYKRLVWELLYEELANDTEDPSMPQYFGDCTIFYEYIYPTYRPIFSPVTDRTGYNHQTLGEDMGRLINEEFLVQNTQLKAMINNNMDFNLFVVAHSQGGLVSRAGLRFIDDRILKHLKQFISWGSPHIGGGLVSLRYALAAGHDMIIDGYRLPLQHIGQSQAYQSALSGLVLDAPGVRDMRYDASKKDMLRLGELLRENTTTLSEFPHTELPNGKMFFSENLNLFNHSEGDWIGDMLRDKYLLYVGTTPKEATIELRFSLRSIYRNYRFAKHASEVEKGAFLNKLTMKPAFNANDGAVPVYSQSATSLWPEGNIKRKHYDDMDHEEFYGAEHPHRGETSIAKGRKVAQDTYNDLGLSSTSPYRATRTCPQLVSIESEQEGDNLIITGRLNYPIYQTAHGGDDKPGARVKRFEAREKDAKGPRLNAFSFTYKDDGSFRAVAKKDLVPAKDIAIVAVMKDNSEVSAKVPGIGAKEIEIIFTVDYGLQTDDEGETYRDTTQIFTFKINLSITTQADLTYEIKNDVELWMTAPWDKDIVIDGVMQSSIIPAVGRKTYGGGDYHIYTYSNPEYAKLIPGGQQWLPGNSFSFTDPGDSSFFGETVCVYYDFKGEYCTASGNCSVEYNYKAQQKCFEFYIRR